MFAAVSAGDWYVTFMFLLQRGQDVIEGKWEGALVALGATLCWLYGRKASWLAWRAGTWPARLAWRCCFPKPRQPSDLCRAVLDALEHGGGLVDNAGTLTVGRISHRDGFATVNVDGEDVMGELTPREQRLVRAALAGARAAAERRAKQARQNRMLDVLTARVVNVLGTEQPQKNSRCKENQRA